MTSLLDAIVSVPGRLAETKVEAAAGERIALIGPNGSGKTSLLRALAGIAGRGVVTVSGKTLSDLPAPQRSELLSYLPASRDVAWPVPVRDLIALGLLRPDMQRVEELLVDLQLGQFADRPIVELSTGERARALLARALAPRPALLLLDEPLSNLDPAWVLRTLDLLDCVTASGATAIVALHDLAQLSRFDRVMLMSRGEVVADARPKDLPAQPVFSETFGIRASSDGWVLNPEGDPQSSP